jgi:flagellar hook-length control protein FliK
VANASPTSKDASIFSSQLDKAQAKTKKPVSQHGAVAGKSPKAPVKNVQAGQTPKTEATEETEAEHAPEMAKEQPPTDQPKASGPGKPKAGAQAAQAQAKTSSDSESRYQLVETAAQVDDQSDQGSSGQHSKDEKAKSAQASDAASAVDGSTVAAADAACKITSVQPDSATPQGDGAPKVAAQAGKAKVSAIKPSDTPVAGNDANDADAADASDAADLKDHAAAKSEAALPASDPTAIEAPAPSPAATTGTHVAATASAAPVAPSPDAQFTQTNHPQIVTSIHGQLLPNGGTMNIHLDPPELGAMQITVKVEGGMVSASFETSNDEATRLLSHTLGQLKGALQLQGVGVERLHVRQTSPAQDRGDAGGEDRNRQQGSDPQSAQQEQQRREMLRRMWRRAGYGRDPLDLVA